MQKKVKSGQYKSKKQFAHDLNLIWDNCLSYNSDPTHPLRRNVQFMRKKANHLLEFISDKSDVKDALVQWGTTAPATATVNANGKVEDGSAKAEVAGKEEVRKRKRRVIAGDEGKFEDQEAFIRTPAGMLEFGRIDAALSVMEGPSSRPIVMAPVEAMDRIKEKEEEEDVLSAVLGSIFPPLTRGKGKEKATPEPLSRSQSQTQSQPSSTPGPSVATSEVSSLDASADWFTVTASHSLMTSALPALPSSSLLPPSDTLSDAKMNGKKRKKPFHLVPATRRKGLQGRIARNIRTLHKVQATHAKFLSLAHYVENEAPIPAYLTSMSSDEEDSDYPSDVEDTSSPVSTFDPPPRRHPLARISAESAREHASYNVRTLLAHQGFEGGHRGAVDVLTDALGEFIGNMGRLLRIYSDRYASSMSAEEMVLHTLQESGGTDVIGLENHIRNDVERYGSKMADLLRKLRGSYREQFNQSTERGVIEDEALFADNGEALVAGNFAEDLGDDYFGFRELGLDRELGMSGLTVPTRLFYGRARNANSALAARGGLVKENVLPYPPPPEPIPLIAAAIGDQIGLLQPFYQEKLREHRARVKHQESSSSALGQIKTKDDEQEEGKPASEEDEEAKQKLDPVVQANTLPDQEQEKQRYKVPPTGKMPRRAIWSVAAERKLVSDRMAMQEKAEREARERANGNGGVAMSTGGAGAATGNKGKEGKLKKNAITA